jgi:mono/diheme cytochrome c family protein
VTEQTLPLVAPRGFAMVSQDPMSTFHNLRTPLLLAASLMLAACAKRGAKDPEGPDAPGPGEQKAAGATLFEKHCAKCHGALGQGKDGTPAVVGEGALARFTTAQELFDFVSKEMPKDAPGSLEPGQYWAILAFDLRANGIDVDGTLGPDNASTYVLHSEGDKADDKADAAKGDNTDDKVSSDVNE